MKGEVEIAGKTPCWEGEADVWRTSPRTTQLPPAKTRSSASGKSVTTQTSSISMKPLSPSAVLPSLPAALQGKAGLRQADRAPHSVSVTQEGVEVGSGPVEGGGKAGRVVKWTRRTNGTVLDFLGSLLFGARATSPLLLLPAELSKKLLLGATDP